MAVVATGGLNAHLQFACICEVIGHLMPREHFHCLDLSFEHIICAQILCAQFKFCLVICLIKFCSQEQKLFFTNVSDME